jgi:small acid-soluble spore protein D (minor alpha/beta-type SASP)
LNLSGFITSYYTGKKRIYPVLVHYFNTCGETIAQGGIILARRTKILVPEARSGLDALKAKVAHTGSPEDAKFEAAAEVGVPLKKGYNGQLTSEQAGKVGGRLGGSMVRELVKMAQENLTKKQ